MGQSHRNPAINSYYAFLESKVEKEAFYAEMMQLISAEPYFFAPYIEMVDYLESAGLPEERASFLKFALERVNQFFSSRKILGSAKDTWTQKEADDIAALLHKYKGLYGPSLKSARLSFLIRNLRRALKPESAREYKNLIYIRHIPDIFHLQKEVAENEVCWVYNTSRQETAAVQQSTNTIVLRSLPHRTEEFSPVDGRHESVRTSFAALFPRTLEVVESFAEEKGGGLGRVVIVRLKPHSRVYRHYDSHPWLKMRNRYHLVVKSKKGSFMTSGIETRVFHEGDLFLFENMKMHTAENDSDDWRVHVIFDMKV
jgi:hypothetical protein